MPSKTLGNIHIVLVEPQVPGNAGAASRAMKNGGLSRLVLVNPWFHDHPQARYMAHGSEDVLTSAAEYPTLTKAIADSVLVVGTTQRRRHNTPFLTPREAAPLILDAARTGLVSILFGREDDGLSNDEVKRCQMLVNIPSAPEQPSLNLSQAVMVMSYELYIAHLPVRTPKLDLAPAQELEAMYDHLEQSLTELGLREWNDGDNYMRSLRRVFSRTRMERRDVASIHKLCGEIDKYVPRVRIELGLKEEP
jgi:tRNA (cytidine32/uridine32-2'-O)-methyltransferase